MTLATGSRLGPYEILGQIGAGGMGEVYRAKDPRLNREVAIKVLPASFSQDADRLRRFEQEAKAAGVLNHPNITAVYDIGSADGAPYVVQELLEGETLRSALAGGKLSPRKAIDFAQQTAQGLAAAHEKGIVHRDLKPENLFVTRDGRIKILDFGLAKLTQVEGSAGSGTNLPTETRGTEPGVVLGTLGYMSPEQVRGKSTDARSDIFSFGAILYEMLSGCRAFQGDSAADTMSAILKEDPPDLSVTNQAISPGLERVVRHCLEKNPEQRFQSARDLAFNLDSLSGASASGLAAIPGARRARRISPLALAAVALALLVPVAFWASRGTSATKSPASRPASHHRVTFQRGNVLFARFTADGQSVVYGAAWGDRPVEIFLARLGSPESRPLGFPGASLLAVSPAGELAILLKKSNLFGVVGTGTLARVPMTGGAPRQVLDEAWSADWSPDGKDLAVLREVGGQDVVEYPIGKRVLSGSAGEFGPPRVSPDGERIAISSYAPVSMVLVDRAGKKTVLAAPDFIGFDSYAWHPSGKEIWISGMRREGTGGVRGVFAMDLAGRVRSVAGTTDLEVLHDIARDGTVLVEREIEGSELDFGSAEEKNERNLSWLETSVLAVLSADGKTMLFSETGDGGGPNGSVYLRTTDGAPAVRLGDGRANDLSPDGKWALVRVRTKDGPRLVLLPTAAGEARTLPIEGFVELGGVFLPPDGKRIVFGGVQAGHGVRGYVMDLPDGKPRAITPEGMGDGGAVSPDGKRVVIAMSDRPPMIYPVDANGGQPRPIPGLDADDVPIQWSADGDSLYLSREGQIPKPIYRYSFSTGKKTLWKELMPTDRAGLVRFENVWVTPDGKHYAYSLNRVTDSDLFAVTGWK